MATFEENFTQHALRVNRFNAQNCNHGYFWEKGKTYGKFYCDAWVAAFTGSEYIVSDGYGGAHAILWGFGGLTGGRGAVSGNVFIDSGTVSFGSQDKVYEGDWHHHALAWDGEYLYTWIDGVLSSRTAASGRRANSGGTGDGNLFVGGSEHSNARALIKNLRIIEGWCPHGATHFRPEFNFKGSYNLVGNRSIPVAFIADYSTPQGIVADLGSGLSNGTRQKMSQVVAGTVSGAGNARSIVTAAGMPNSPKTVTFVVSNTWTASQVAAAARLALLQDADVGTFFIVYGTGANVILEAVEEQANDATYNFTIENVTSTGITDDTTAVQDTKGYAGQLVRHPGMLGGQTNGSDLGGFDDGIAAHSRYGDVVAQIVPVAFERPAVFRGTQTSIPVGATFYDDFSRVNVTKLWDETIDLGTLRTGQRWFSPDMGIIDGKAFAWTASGVKKIATVDFGASDHDVSVRRATGSDAEMQTIVRYTDPDNYVFVGVAAGQYISMKQVVGGVESDLSSMTGNSSDAGAGWNTIRVTAVGTLITVYIDGSGTEIAHGTTALTDGDECGFAITTAYTRVMEFRAQ